MGDDGAEGLADHRPLHVVLGKPAGPEIDLIDPLVEGGLQAASVSGSVVSCSNDGVGRQVQCFAGLVQGAEPEIVAALDIDRGEVHLGRRIRQEVAQAVDNAGVERLRRIGGEVPQEAIGATNGSLKSAAFMKNASLEFDLAATNPEIVHPLGVIAHDGVPEPIGGTGELLGNARVRGRIKALDRA